MQRNWSCKLFWLQLVQQNKKPCEFHELLTLLNHQILSTSCSIHYINGNYVYGTARTQKVVSLSSCESELHAIVSGMSDAIFLRCENRERIYQLETTRLEESSLPIPLTQFYNMVGRLRHDVDVQEQSLETINDTMETFQYGLVEMGGFVRLRELNLDQRMWLHRTERANLVAFSAFGAGEYLRLVNQRGRVFQADDTEQGEGAEEEDEMEVDLSVFPPGPFSVMVEILKDEAARCVAMGHNESARIIQKYVMEPIDVINGGINDEKIALWRRKMAQCYATLR
ncbi:unnamed protein product, partial [Effrenium voratum]